MPLDPHELEVVRKNYFFELCGLPGFIYNCLRHSSEGAFLPACILL